VQNLAGERAIHIVIFFLLLIGLCGIIGWAIYAAVPGNLISIPGIALSWGIILLLLYVAFAKLGWKWWE